jgi:Ca-activated chloride channel family protein
MWASVRIDAAGPALENQRAPLAIALVLDVSGSMKGEPLEHVLRSCEIVAELLDARDKLAIVTFSDTAGVRCGLVTTDAAGKDMIKAALRDVRADGSTNIHHGLEVGAGVLVTAPAGLRRAMVVMSDGQPNIGIASASGLAGIVSTLGVAVSTLGFGIHHDDDVLDAMATAGSGRYAYVPDPLLARVDLARAALAHGGIVADHLELGLALAEGVELLQIVPAAQPRFGASGLKMTVGDVFIDEGRSLALELKLDLSSSKGRLATVTVDGQSPNGAKHALTAELRVDVHAGPHAIDRDAQREIILVQAEAARAAARAHADRGAVPAAVVLLREVIARIEASDGFVAGDASPLSEMREQLVDEITNYERRASDAEKQHQRKGARSYKPHQATPHARAAAPVKAQLVVMNGPRAGNVQQLFLENSVGRSHDNELSVMHASLSRRHARILFVNGEFVVSDLGSSNGTKVNGAHVDTRKLAHGDVIRLGEIELRFEKL